MSRVCVCVCVCRSETAVLNIAVNRSLPLPHHDDHDSPSSRPALQAPWSLTTRPTSFLASRLTVSATAAAAAAGCMLLYRVVSRHLRLSAAAAAATTTRSPVT